MTRSDARITEKEMCGRARRATAVAVQELLNAEPGVGAPSRESRAAVLQDRARFGAAVQDAAREVYLHGVTTLRERGLAEALSGERVAADLVDRIAWRLVADSAGQRTHTLSM